ncbi:hypothetical protein [Nonomuraea salmonea]
MSANQSTPRPVAGSLEAAMASQSRASAPRSWKVASVRPPPSTA